MYQRCSGIKLLGFNETQSFRVWCTSCEKEEAFLFLFYEEAQRLGSEGHGF